MSFSERQLRAMALSPKVASSFSILGSSFILYESLMDYRQGKGSSAVKRALMGMSCVDVLSSLAWFLSTWAAPEETGALYAAGNDATCAFQGFLLQIAIGAPMYNGALVLYYLLIIKYNWSNERLLKIEPWVHMFIWIWCLGTSIVLLALNLLNFIGPVCWVSDPASCFEDPPRQDGVVPCGDSKYYSTAFFCVPLWIAILLTMYALMCIFYEVRSTTVRALKHGTRQGTDVSLRRSSRNVREVALRSVLYSIAFIITWAASTVWSVAQWFDYYPFWVSYLWTLMEPLQGLWNVLIFIHNRPDSRKKIIRFIHIVSCGLCAGREENKAESSGTGSTSRSAS